MNSNYSCRNPKSEFQGNEACHASRKSLCHRKFTLIELLLVIAIIAILMTILLPALSRAKQMAKQISCASNLKGWGLGLVQYTMDFDGWYPTKAGNGGADYMVREGLAISGISMLKSYGIQKNIVVCPTVPSVGGYNSTSYQNNWENESSALCTGYTYFAGTSQSPYNQDKGTPYGWQVGAGYMTPQRHAPTVNIKFTVYKNWYSQVIPYKPEDDGVMMDVFYEANCYIGHSTKFSSYCPSSGSSESSFVFAEIYCMGGNVLYADGHIAWVKPNAATRRRAATQYSFFY